MDKDQMMALFKQMLKENPELLNELSDDDTKTVSNNGNKYSNLRKDGFIEGLQKEDFNNPDLYEALYNLPNASKGEMICIIDRLSDRAKDLKKLGIFKELWETKKDEKEKIKARAEENRIATTVFENLPEFCTGNKLIGKEWVTSGTGHIARIVKSGRTVKEEKACAEPILINRDVRRLDGHEENRRVEIVYKDGNVWKKKIVDLEILTNSKKAISLANIGIPLTSETVKIFSSFMANMYELNKADMPTLYTMTSLGWDKEFKVFLPHTDTEYVFEREAKFPKLLQDLKPHGSRDAWYDEFKRIRKFEYLPFKVVSAATLSGMILEMKGIDSFIVNMYGDTTTGKSVNSLMCASMQVNPKSEDVIVSSSLTQVGLEIKLDVLNNYAIYLEDTAQLGQKQEDEFRSIIMMIANGRGKTRGNIDLSTRRVCTWKCPAIITSEKDIKRYWSNGGSQARVISVMNEERPEYFDEYDKILPILEENYGWAALDFSNILIEYGKEKINHMVDEYYKKLMPIIKKHNKSPRQAINVAVLLTVDELMEKHLFKDGIRMTEAEALSLLDDEVAFNPHERHYNYLINTALMNPLYFEGLSENDVINIKWGIYKENDKGNTTLAFNINKFEELCATKGVDLKLFTKWLMKNELLIHEKDRLTKKVNRNERMYKFIIKKDESEDDEEIRKEEAEKNRKFIIQPEDFGKVDFSKDLNDSDDIPFEGVLE